MYDLRGAEVAKERQASLLSDVEAHRLARLAQYNDSAPARYVFGVSPGGCLTRLVSIAMWPVRRLYSTIMILGEGNP